MAIIEAGGFKNFFPKIFKKIGKSCWRNYFDDSICGVKLREEVKYVLMHSGFVKKDD